MNCGYVTVYSSLVLEKGFQKGLNLSSDVNLQGNCLNSLAQFFQPELLLCNLYIWGWFRKWQQKFGFDSLQFVWKKQIVSQPFWNAVVLILEDAEQWAPWINFTASTRLTPAFTQRVSKVSQMFNVQLPSIKLTKIFDWSPLRSYNFVPIS